MNQFSEQEQNTILKTLLEHVKYCPKLGKHTTLLVSNDIDGIKKSLFSCIPYYSNICYVYNVDNNEEVYGEEDYIVPPEAICEIPESHNINWEESTKIH